MYTCTVSGSYKCTAAQVDDPASGPGEPWSHATANGKCPPDVELRRDEKLLDVRSKNASNM